jgi:DNA-binding MarR family transcriptional regulator
MSQTPVLTGQDIAEAYGAVEARLERALSSTGTTNREYVVLRVLAARPFESPASLHEYLAAQRQLALSPAAVGELLAGLESRTLASGTAKNDPGPAKLTPNRTELLRRLTDAVAPTSREVFAGIAPEDLATAHNVLRQIIDRTAGSASGD